MSEVELVEPPGLLVGKVRRVDGDGDVEVLSLHKEVLVDVLGSRLKLPLLGSV